MVNDDGFDSVIPMTMIMFKCEELKLNIYNEISMLIIIIETVTMTWRSLNNIIINIFQFESN